MIFIIIITIFTNITVFTIYFTYSKMLAPQVKYLFALLRIGALYNDGIRYLRVSNWSPLFTSSV